MKKLVVCGATGRFGSLICQCAEQSGHWQVVGKVNRQSPLEGSIAKGDCIIDFSLPTGTVHHVALARQHHKPIVIGTTGLSETELEQVKNAAQAIPILHSPNMSLGVNVLFRLIEQAAKALQQGFEIAISETHHTKKLDAPSGTAKAMGKIVEQITGTKPPIESIREGDVVGEHTIVFGSPTEHLAIMHRALDRKIFALGALRAAEWLLRQPPGLYSMADVLFPQ